MINRFSARIHWSEQDAIFIAAADELPGCLADGKTPQEALSNLAPIIDEWIEVAKEEGRSIPDPLTLEALEREVNNSRAEFESQFQSQVAAAVSKLLNRADEPTFRTAFRSRRHTLAGR